MANRLPKPPLPFGSEMSHSIRRIRCPHEHVWPGSPANTKEQSGADTQPSRHPPSPFGSRRSSPATIIIALANKIATTHRQWAATNKFKQCAERNVKHKYLPKGPGHCQLRPGTPIPQSLAQSRPASGASDDSHVSSARTLRIRRVGRTYLRIEHIAHAGKSGKGHHSYFSPAKNGFDSSQWTSSSPGLQSSWMVRWLRCSKWCRRCQWFSCHRRRELNFAPNDWRQFFNCFILGHAISVCPHIYITIAGTYIYICIYIFLLIYIYIYLFPNCIYIY